MITDRDIEILKLILLLRFINTQQLSILIPYAGKTQSIVVTRRRMVRLEKEGLVNSYQPDKYSHKVFYLSEKGAEFLCAYLGLDKIETYRRNNKINHQLKIVDTYISLWSLQKKDGFVLEKAVLDLKLIQEKKDFKPDLFYCLTKDEKKYLGFVEVDMGTEKIKSYIMRKKIPKYKVLFQGGAYQETYGEFPTVYFLTISEERAKNLARELKKDMSGVNYKVTTFKALEDILGLIGGRKNEKE